MGGPIAQDAHSGPHPLFFEGVRADMFRFSRFVYNFRDNLVRVWKVENRSPVYQRFAEKVIHSAQTRCV